MAGALEQTGDGDYFRMEVVEAGRLTVETTGERRPTSGWSGEYRPARTTSRSRAGKANKSSGRTRRWSGLCPLCASSPPLWRNDWLCENLYCQPEIIKEKAGRCSA